jgi:hypothetical protein
MLELTPIQSLKDHTIHLIAKNRLIIFELSKAVAFLKIGVIFQIIRSGKQHFPGGQ